MNTWHLLTGDAAASLLPQVNWRGWWAPRGQWERSGAESTFRLYYSVVPLPAADASPAQPVTLQHLLVNGLYSFPPSATSAGGVPDAFPSGLQRGVTGTFISVSSLLLFFYSFSSFFLYCDKRACTRAQAWVSVTLCRCVTAGDRHGCRVACWYLNTEILVARRRPWRSSGAAARALRRTPALKSEQSSLVAGGCKGPACWRGDTPGWASRESPRQAIYVCV